jgi:hypothetical protein
MVDLGKCRIRQLKNFQGKMMAVGNLKEFSDMFAPFDENYAIELAEKAMLSAAKQDDSGLMAGPG